MKGRHVMTETCESPSTQAGRKWVRNYAIALQVGAAVILIMEFSPLWMVVSVARGHGISIWFSLLYSVFHLASGLAYAMIPLVLSCLLRYVFGERQNPGWILRNGAWAFFGLAAAKVLANISSTVFFSQIPRGPGWGLLLYSPDAVVTALVWFALGLVLRRVLPIIEESKTLV